MARSKDRVPLVSTAGLAVAALVLLLCCATQCGKYVLQHFTHKHDEQRSNKEAMIDTILVTMLDH